LLVVVVVVVCCAGTQVKKIERENDNSCNTGLHKIAEKEQKKQKTPSKTSASKNICKKSIGQTKSQPT
jgi:hypothetical protein